MITRKKITTLLTLLIGVSVQAQNLVPNPSFETYSACPTGVSQLQRATPWTKPTRGSSDYFNPCACVPDPLICVPTNEKGTQTPRTGNAYVGIYAFWGGPGNPNSREYIQAPLTSALTAGQEYEVLFYVSLSEESPIALDPLSVYFSASSFNINTYNNLNYTPQLTSTGVITDKSAWTLVSYCYTATGGEQYITIGNFDTDANTTQLGGQGGTSIHSYYYIDDVSVVAGASCTLPIELLSFNAVAIKNKESLLTWQTASEINNDYFTIEKSVDAVNWKELIRVDGAGNSSTILNYQTIDQNPFIPITYYRLKQTDFNGDYSYSNIEPVHFNGIDLVNVYPNPTEGVLTLNISASENVLINLNVINSLGQNVIQQQFEVKKETTLKTINTDNLASGVYQIKITTPTGEFSFKKFNRK